MFDSGNEIDCSFYAVLGGKLLATAGGERLQHLAAAPVRRKSEPQSEDCETSKKSRKCRRIMIISCAEKLAGAYRTRLAVPHKYLILDDLRKLGILFFLPSPGSPTN